MKDQAKSSKQQSTTSVVLARENDGTIQLTITILSEDVKKAEQQVLEELAKTITIAGFRAGKAPLGEVKKQVSAQTVVEHILQKLLPDAYQKAITRHNLHPILSPRFELIKAPLQNFGPVNGQGDWQVRTITCEAPTVELGDYQAKLGDHQKKKKELTAEEKEQTVVQTLLATTKAVIPKPLIEEEVNHRLSLLVEQTQKLGLTVDQYLNQTGKTTESLRSEYSRQASEQITTMLALSAVARQEGIEIPDDEIDKVVASAGPQHPAKDQPMQRELVRGMLSRRRALDRLTTLL